MTRINLKVLTKNANEILNKLSTLYPDAGCELNYGSDFQLLIATVLSAQTTDKSVNKVTSRLFCKYPTLDDFLKLEKDVIEYEIKEIGLYRNKAKSIYTICRQLKDNFGSAVPNDMENLISLFGVGRKTANVVLSNAFMVPAIAVDTHVFRVSNRIGLAESNNEFGTEKQLMNIIPREKWILAHHLLIWHGRRVCTAKKPKCNECPIIELCKYAKLR